MISQIIYRILYNKVINKIILMIIFPFKKYVPNTLRLPPNGMINFTVRGKKIKLSTNQTSYLTQLIYWNGANKFEYTPIFEELATKVDSFIDIGANIGYYSLIAAKLNRNMKVIAFEPASGPLHYLKRNIRINKMDTMIKVEEIALSDREEEVTFYEIKNKKYRFTEHNLGGEGNLGSKTTGRNFVTTTVQATTMDKYVKENPDQIDLIKIDTEGTEHHILSHAKEMLEQMRPIIICETLFNTIEAELETIMTSLGYEFYNHVGTQLEKVPSIIRSTDNGVRNCFFVHPTKSHLIESFVKS